ncbi:hypothetical protein [Nonomuraea insulae]|uniref:Lipoprotein LpqE n=1 Tax=Nonomuraea insulae TaxID=1616787 RepID=A0ABW1CQV1_9ACTN
MPATRPIVTAVIVVALAATGCTNAGFDKDNRAPQNDGANADDAGGTLLLRNAFLLNESGDATSPSPQQALFAVLINEAGRPDQLERITVDGGGSVQLSGPLTLPPNQPVGTGSQPIGTISGVRGTQVPMTFTFKDAKAVRVSVPVKQRIGQFANLPTVPAAPPSPTVPATVPATG